MKDCSLDGYCSDQTVTLPVGDVDSKAREVHETVLKAQLAAIESIAQGVALGEVDSAAREVIGQAGFGEFFGHGTGHSIGMEVHELPSVAPGVTQEVEEGLVFTVEPGIYLPGEFGVRLEDMIYINGGLPERITTLPKELGAI